MGGDFAGTDLPPSAVHALIEIDNGEITARDLGEILNLEKSSISRMLRKLLNSGDIKQETGKEDSRKKILSLTAKGKKRVSAIHKFAREQVSKAIIRLKPGQDRMVLEGLQLYAGALNGQDVQSLTCDVVISSGYRAGIIARITEMHALYYATSGFGQPFESVVAGGLAEFCGRLDQPMNRIWVAIRDGQILGSVAIDGEDLGPGIAHLRWFIVDDTLRGSGAGKLLLDAAFAFVDAAGFEETHLWTFSDLHAAKHLYETRGFILEEERLGTQWGKEVLEQRFVRMRR